MTQFTNVNNIALSMAVFLAHDKYDHNADPCHISATGLLKPTKQILLAKRVPKGEGITDISGNIASRIGTAIHDGIEDAWLTNYKESMLALNIPQKVIDRVLVNPTADELYEGCIPVYLEVRTSREIDGFIISGMYDFVGDGRVEDFKSTGTYTFTKKTNDAKYIKQGSIYRWLNPEIITQDQMAIQFIFTDWQANLAKSNKAYPQTKCLEYVLPLDSLSETESFIRGKLAELKRCQDLPEEGMPDCTSEELWRRDPVWKYYKKGEVTARSTKNYENAHDAHIRLVEDGGSGLIVHNKGEVVACKYCSAFTVCKQKDALIASGDLKL